ncbi:hypothetical protein Tco_0072013 [Tanacetum coccineum]
MEPSSSTTTHSTAIGGIEALTSMMVSDGLALREIVTSVKVLTNICTIDHLDIHISVRVDLFLIPKSARIVVFSTWMTFRRNTRDLGSFGEETDEITDLHQIHEEILFSERGDGVTGIKRHRRDPSSDGVRDLVTASGRGLLNEDLESST